MAKKKSTAALLAAVEKQHTSEKAPSKRGRPKGSKNRKKASSGTCLDTSDVNKAISVVGRTIRKLEQATGGKFVGRQIMGAKIQGAGGSPRKKAGVKKARKRRAKK